MAFLSHLRPNNKSKKPITKRKTFRGIKVTKATPRVATITASVATAANAPTIALRQLLVIRATRTRVNASTNSTAAARNAAMTIAHCICYFSPVLCKIRARMSVTSPHFSALNDLRQNGLDAIDWDGEPDAIGRRVELGI